MRHILNLLRPPGLSFYMVSDGSPPMPVGDSAPCHTCSRSSSSSMRSPAEIISSLDTFHTPRSWMAPVQSEASGGPALSNHLLLEASPDEALNLYGLSMDRPTSNTGAQSHLQEQAQILWPARLVRIELSGSPAALNAVLNMAQKSEVAHSSALPMDPFPTATILTLILNASLETEAADLSHVAIEKQALNVEALHSLLPQAAAIETLFPHQFNEELSQSTHNNIEAPVEAEAVLPYLLDGTQASGIVLKQSKTLSEEVSSEFDTILSTSCLVVDEDKTSVTSQGGQTYSACLCLGCASDIIQAATSDLLSTKAAAHFDDQDAILSEFFADLAEDYMDIKTLHMESDEVLHYNLMHGSSTTLNQHIFSNGNNTQTPTINGESSLDAEEADDEATILSNFLDALDIEESLFAAAALNDSNCHGPTQEALSYHLYGITNSKVSKQHMSSANKILGVTSQYGKGDGSSAVSTIFHEAASHGSALSAGNSMAVRMPDSTRLRALDIDPPNAAYDATTAEDAETSNGSAKEDAIISEFLEALDEKSFSPTAVFLPMALLMQHMAIYLSMEASYLHILEMQISASAYPLQPSFHGITYNIFVMLSLRLRGRNSRIQAHESTTKAKQKNFKDRAKTNAKLLIFFTMKSTLDPG